MWGNRITLWDLGSGVLFPQPVAIEDTDLAAYAMPEARRDALRSLARALAGGEIVLDPGADREEAGRRLVSLRGVGPWTASYVAMRTLGDPDAFLPTDLGVRRSRGSGRRAIRRASTRAPNGGGPGGRTPANTR